MPSSLMTACSKVQAARKQSSDLEFFDHVSMKYRKGYHLMTLGWTDGNTFLLVNSGLLASSNDSNLIGLVVNYDGRYLAANRGKLARMKETEVMIELLKNAQSAGHHADYVFWIPGFLALPRSLLSKILVWISLP